ncbi:hemolymph trypsin inhibitor B-like isoform X1 [Erinaceus europaeus]|uniref:Hemolymph trypsin inhibitor B-like isoform X1 n=1 Tax=Erinaceus europaeus TaxID=9365 RepID=A0ABM3YEG1_ERIEU|nr:hemolymph trypsin inhibitor B-like isoform X1 [Erinaceus europaeus]
MKLWIHLPVLLLIIYQGLQAEAGVRGYMPKWCLLPPKSGPCKGRKLRWRYDSNISKCRVFLYGGCEGNDNNFETEGKCRKICRKSGH